MRDEKGRFLKGNKFSKSEIGELRKMGAKELLKLMDQFGSKGLQQLQAYSTDRMQAMITTKEAAIIRFWIELIKKGDIGRMKLLFNIYGIPTEIKAVAIKDLSELDMEMDFPERDAAPELSKDEKLDMIEKYKALVISGENE